ncbi:hypothetical protein IQ250_27820 [Pseudanabaenaceae cyanobacterium LEGE 13415]|nr:hypothetical protein [Pseudanabaenaceae cyanobacterium LEGE 13415]
MSTYPHMSACRVQPESIPSKQVILWMGNAGENLVRAIALQTIGIELILDISIAQIELMDLKVQVTPETVRILGAWKKSAHVEGFFCPEQFESLIPLPYAVFPEATTVKQHNCGIIVHLARQLEDEPVTVQLDLTNKQWAIPEVYS